METSSMSYSRLLFAGLCVSNILIFSGYAAAATLNLKPGLWEMTTTGETKGAPPIPADVLAQMPPERRAKFEAAMAANANRTSAPHANKQCITENSLQRGLKVDDNKNESGCQQTVVSSTASVMDMRMNCTSPQRSSSGTFHFETAGPEAVNGTINMTISDGAHSMTIKRVIQGKWLGADCGNLKRAGD
jgi:Protein of unknown function (DUF3617)